MDRPSDERRDYLIARIHEALSRDPRVGELELEVSVTGGTVLVSGTVASDEQRRAVSEVVEELLPGHRVANEVALATFPETGEAERL
ncbi:MAG TPA: BON domain-containing protein [Actinomycetota bacterium]|nr:BON domain-containing protein [Actinomycetota bacterium]